MALKQKIQQDLNIAAKGKKPLEVLILRQLLAAILNKEKEKRFRLFKAETDLVDEAKASSPAFANAQLIDEEVIEAISSEIKKRKEAILAFEGGGRQDLVDKETKEKEILEKYLPEQLSEQEIKKLTEVAVEKVEAKELKDMGKVMQELLPQVKGKADGSLVSKIVKELLNPDGRN